MKYFRKSFLIIMLPQAVWAVTMGNSQIKKQDVDLVMHLGNFSAEDLNVKSDLNVTGQSLIVKTKVAGEGILIGNSELSDVVFGKGLTVTGRLKGKNIQGQSLTVIGKTTLESSQIKNAIDITSDDVVLKDTKASQVIIHCNEWRGKSQAKAEIMGSQVGLVRFEGCVGKVVSDVKDLKVENAVMAPK